MTLASPCSSFDCSMSPSKALPRIFRLQYAAKAVQKNNHKTQSLKKVRVENRNTIIGRTFIVAINSEGMRIDMAQIKAFFSVFPTVLQNLACSGKTHERAITYHTSIKKSTVRTTKAVKVAI